MTHRLAGELPDAEAEVPVGTRASTWQALLAAVGAVVLTGLWLYSFDRTDGGPCIPRSGCGIALVVFVQAPDGSTVVDPFTINRGREYEVDFTADQTGHYKIVCMSHAPTMTADILSIGG